MKQITINQQLNAIQKHVNRNNLTVEQWTVFGDDVYCDLKSGGYITFWGLLRQDYADLISSTSPRSYSATLL